METSRPKSGTAGGSAVDPAVDPAVASARDPTGASIRSPDVVLQCDELQPTLAFFLERLGFRLDRIVPADDPRCAWISGHGTRIELAQVALSPSPRDPVSQQELVVCRQGDESAWVSGRAGMLYRDLIPGRLDGRVIASRIRIPVGGPVPDQVHFHAVRFQMIFCLQGWVRVAYQDQGPPRVLSVGDCFLQPAGLRHRVLECSDELEVLELACPAEHDTWFDHDLRLPTPEPRPGLEYAGQGFVHHVAIEAPWQQLPGQGLSFRDTGIAAATGRLADVMVLRRQGASGASDARDTTASTAAARSLRHDGELLFLYVLAGSLTLEGLDDAPLRLSRADSVAVPAGSNGSLSGYSDDLEFLEVRLPGTA
jgi:quercetin dioxygenase-like cupin family protein